MVLSQCLLFYQRNIVSLSNSNGNFPDIFSSAIGPYNLKSLFRTIDSIIVVERGFCLFTN